MIDIVIEKPKITTTFNEDGSEGEFVIEPLERGYGTTLGNSLRRVLLSTLAGYAATSIKIEGVLHEISTVDGVKEGYALIVDGQAVVAVIPELCFGYEQKADTLLRAAETLGKEWGKDILLTDDMLTYLILFRMRRIASSRIFPARLLSCGETR